jgi:hypothetical protein
VFTVTWQTALRSGSIDKIQLPRPTPYLTRDGRLVVTRSNTSTSLARPLFLSRSRCSRQQLKAQRAHVWRILHNPLPFRPLCCSVSFRRIITSSPNVLSSHLPSGATHTTRPYYSAPPRWASPQKRPGRMAMARLKSSRASRSTEEGHSPMRSARGRARRISW